MRSDPPERALARTGAPARAQAGGSPVALRIEERDAPSDHREEGEAEGDLLYWRTRARELEAQLAAMRARLIALADRLPASVAPLVGSDPDALLQGVRGCDPLEDWEETTLLKPSSVAQELPRLWEKLERTRVR